MTFSKGFLGKLVPFLLMAAAFFFFVSRDDKVAQEETAEDVLINMIVAMSDGRVGPFLNCFGGDLRQRLETVVEAKGESSLSEWLKNRGQLIKGFAILEKQPLDDSTLKVKTETVYEDRNTAQTFLVSRSPQGWKILQSDFEMVADWDTDFGKPVWEAR